MKKRKCHQCGKDHQRQGRFCSDTCSRGVFGSLSESEWKAKMNAALKESRSRRLARLIDEVQQATSSF